MAMTGQVTIDRPLEELTDAALARPMATALGRARADVLAAAADLLAIPEAALTRPWGWKGGSEEEVRYGAYRAGEALVAAEIEARFAIGGTPDTRAAAAMGHASAARWDLHGLLLPLEPETHDADPGGGEWTIRQTLAHVINSQRAYGWSTAWWVANPHDRDDPNLPRTVPEDVWATLPDEADEAPGTPAEIRDRLDTTLDLGAERMAGAGDDQLGYGARWSGFAVTVAFRLNRWSSHIREHAIQVEKTLARLGRVPTEPERLVRHLLATYGRAEAVAFVRRDADAAAEQVAKSAAEARETIRAAREAAEAPTADGETTPPQ
jgi:hypothetical protein